MKKIISNSSIKNSTLRNRKDLSPLCKTAIHKYHNCSMDHFEKWAKLLSEEEKESIDFKPVKIFK